MFRPAILLLSAFLAAGPLGSPAAAAIDVAVSIAPVKHLVEQIGGDAVRVTVLVPPGQSPETYQPTDAQISQVMRAAVFIRVGMPFEQGQAFQAIRSVSTLRVVDLREGLKLREIEGHHHSDDENHRGEHHHHHDHALDPHIWLSARLLRTQAATIAAALVEIDPERRSTYEANLRALDQRLEQLDTKLTELLKPHVGRAFIVFHPSWGYFADDYKLRQIAIEASGQLPSDQQLTELQKQAKAEQIKVVFVQPQFSRKAASAVAQAIGARVEVLDPLADNVEENLLAAGESIARSAE